MAIYRNRAAIIALEIGYLQMLAMTAKPSVLRKLAAGFPELVTDGETDDPWPLSLLQRAARDKLATNDPDITLAMVECDLPEVTVEGYVATFEDGSVVELNTGEVHALKTIHDRNAEPFPFALNEVKVGGRYYYPGPITIAESDRTDISVILYPITCVRPHERPRAL